MFFFATFGLNQKMEPIAKVLVQCPQCKQQELFQIYCDYDSFELFFVSVAKYNKRYMALCCNCATVYTLDYEIGSAWQRGKQPPIKPEHLHLSASQSHSCPRCGNGIRADFAFCPRCGCRLSSS